MEQQREELLRVKAQLTETFQRGITRPLSYRQAQLRQLIKCLRERQADWLAALQADFKSKADSLLEWKRVVAEAERTLELLPSWMEAEAVQLPGVMGLAGRGWVEWNPRGVCLIIGAWNYPLDLLAEPLLGAMAAGCCALLKASERAPQTAACWTRLLPEYLDGEAYAVCEGEAQLGSWLGEQPWDLIFFTGSTATGRLVARQAAATLSPCLLELGGRW